MSDPLERCENCGREFPESKVHSHYAYCRRNIRKCRQCGEFIDINEEEQHVLQVHFRQPCQYCNRHFPKDQLPTHQQGCPAKCVHCRFCEVPVKQGQLDQHTAMCGSRTKPCSVCHRNVMLLEFEQHEQDCQAKLLQSSMKAAQNMQSGDRQAPPPVPAKYRIQRFTDQIPRSAQPSKTSQSASYEDYEAMGFSEQEIATQRALFEHLEQKNRASRQRC